MCPVYSSTQSDGEIIFGFLVLLGFNSLFAIIASTLVAFEVSTYNVQHYIHVLYMYMYL